MREWAFPSDLLSIQDIYTSGNQYSLESNIVFDISSPTCILFLLCSSFLAFFMMFCSPSTIIHFGHFIILYVENVLINNFGSKLLWQQQQYSYNRKVKEEGKWRVLLFCLKKIMLFHKDDQMKKKKMEWKVGICKSKIPSWCGSLTKLNKENGWFST